MKAKLLLKLLMSAHSERAWSGLSRRKRERGFSLAVAMLVIFVVILGSVVIVSRSTSGLLGANYQTSNRQAREVAEAGILEIITELNKEPNRKLLISSAGATTSVPTGWTTANTGNFVNPCTRITGPYAPGAPVQKTAEGPTARAVSFGAGTVIAPNGSTTTDFQLVGIDFTYTPDPVWQAGTTATRTDYTMPTNIYTGTGVGPYNSGNAAQDERDQALMFGLAQAQIKLTVLGRVKNSSGTVISQARVTREFEVIPKCCKLSFGRNQTGNNLQGQDDRVCMADLGAGLGLIVSLDGGAVAASGNSFNLRDELGNPVTRVLCDSTPISGGAANTACTNGTLTIGSNVSVVPAAINFVNPTYPAPPTYTGTITDVLRDQIVNSSRAYIRVNQATQVVEQCTVNAAGTTLSGCTPRTNCDKVTVALNGNDQFHCRVTSISTSNNNLIVDTSNGIINLYFDDPAATTATNYISLGGNGSLQHQYCPGGQSLLAACQTGASVLNADRLNFHSDGVGNFDIRGTGSTLAMNLYAPKASSRLNGGGAADPNFSGRMWVNEFTRNGNIKMQVNNTSPAFCAILGNTCPSATLGTPAIDWKARSVSQSSSF